MREDNQGENQNQNQGERTGKYARDHAADATGTENRPPEIQFKVRAENQTQHQRADWIVKAAHKIADEAEPDSPYDVHHVSADGVAADDGNHHNDRH